MLVGVLTLLLVLFISNSINGKRWTIQGRRVTGSLPLRVMEYQYVHNAYRRTYNQSEKCISHDPDFHPLSYEVKQNMVWNNRSVCTNNTFVLLMIFTYSGDVERRDTIRRYIKQGMIVDGKVVNYVQIIAANETDRIVLFEKENEKWQDLLISHHKDIREEWPITIFDAYMWVRDYCKQAKYVSKVDGDMWIHLGNLVHFLKTAPSEMFYGGHVVNGVLHSGRYYKGVKYSPSDCPEHPVSFNTGGGNFVSQDVVPYISIGTQYLDYILPAAEDILIGFMLRKAGIRARGVPGFRVILLFERLPNSTIPQDAVFVHIKGLRTFEEVYRNYSSIATHPYAALVFALCFTNGGML